jgi:hypothetical protein
MERDEGMIMNKVTLEQDVFVYSKESGAALTLKRTDDGLEIHVQDLKVAVVLVDKSENAHITCGIGVKMGCEITTNGDVV